MSPSCPIHILLCTDSHYAPYCGVTATSALENAGGHPVEVHIFTDHLTADEIRRFKALESRYDCHVDINPIPRHELLMLPQDVKQWPPSSFMRLMAAKLLPADLQRVIYLDCDIAVDSPLLPLWKMALGDKLCAVAPDGPDDHPNRVYKATLEVNSVYFNSGIMVMNLDAMRQSGILDQALDILRTSGNKYRCPDQDVLNILINGRVVYLPISCNLQSSQLLRHRPHLPASEASLVSKILRHNIRAIIHYTSEFKPWTTDINHWHPLASIWHRYRRQSLWAKEARPDLSLRTRFAIWRLAIAYRLLYSGPFAQIWK